MDNDNDDAITEVGENVSIISEMTTTATKYQRMLWNKLNAVAYKIDLLKMELVKEEGRHELLVELISEIGEINESEDDEIDDIYG